MGLLSMIGTAALQFTLEAIDESMNERTEIHKFIKEENKNFSLLWKEALEMFNTPNSRLKMLMEMCTIGIMYSNRNGIPSIKQKQEIDSLMNVILELIQNSGEDIAEMESIFILLWEINANVNIDRIFEQAFESMEKLNLESMDLFTSWIAYLIYIDGNITEEELEFMQLWVNLLQRNNKAMKQEIAINSFINEKNKNFNSNYEEVVEILNDYEKVCSLLINLFSLGLSYLSVNDTISDKQRKEINIPANTMLNLMQENGEDTSTMEEFFTTLWITQPSMKADVNVVFKRAYESKNELGLPSMDLYTSWIARLMSINGSVSSEDSEFMRLWISLLKNY